ncbi:MAG TPA: MHYT domain-containing protein [Terriglobales bacterium]|jgi:PAS domain S-box-containing protein|nr:MHYT domain-containing protein [Terriglobales bacterium]
MAAVNLIGSYNYALVALSVFIAMFASYAALDLASRVTAASGWSRALWVLGGAGAMGTGIWSMHYIGMLAFILPIPVAYHWPTVLLSLLAAILASVVALYVVSRQRMNASRAVAGSLLMGAGIACMHYIGMAAMRLSAICQFNSFLVVLSVVLAILISLAALWISFHFRDEKTGIGREKLTGAVVMGAAIPIMHYTGMAAASFTPSGAPADLSHAVSISALGIAGIVAVTFVVLGLALLTSRMDRRFAAKALELQEEKLQRSEAYLAEAQRLSRTGSWARASATGAMRYWSEECYRVLGFDPRDGLPRFETFLQRVHPDDQAKVTEISAAAGRDKVDYETDYRIVHPGGEIRDIHVVAHPVFNPSGDLLEYVGTVMDVTERKRTEEKLRQSEAYLAEAQKLTHTGSWVWDVAERRAVHLSEEWYRVYGFDPKEGISAWNKRLERIHPDERVGRQQAIDRAISGKSDYELEYRILLPGGAVRHVHSVGHPVLNVSGDLVQFVGSSTDITERRQAEEALRQAQAELARISRITTMGELTASLAHEVNQPIAAAVTDASTCLRWLNRDHPDLEEAREAASRVVKDATRAAEIIGRTRLLFKKANPQWEPVDIHEIIREMVILMSGEAARHSISVSAELASELSQVMGDRVQLQQVLMNLMMNSIEAMKDVDGPRELTIRSRTEDGQVMVSVSDTGVGLPPQQADQIFNAFFTTKAHGTGMGLRISRSIVESHGGRLWAEGNSPRGAIFHFTLPTKVDLHE